MAKKKSKKKRDPYSELTDEGYWNAEKNRLKGAVRMVFRRSPQMQIVMHEARVELPPKLKKDGTPGKKNQVRYRCAICKGLFPQKHVNVDHIETVVPLWRKEADMCFNDIARGILCKVDNLQVLCSVPMKDNNGEPSCHRIKTNEENFIRKHLFKQQDSFEDVSKTKINKLIKEFKVLYQEKLKTSKKAKNKKKRVKK